MGLGTTILVVEDQPAERDALVTLLRTEGYEAPAVGDAESALRYLSADIDLILCDLRLERSDGIDLMRHWKQQRSATPFIFISGVAEVPRAVEAIKSGAEDYITKPFRAAELLTRISECLHDAEPSPTHALDRDAEQFATRADALRLDLPADASMDEIERAAIERALEKHNGNRTRAAHSLGISVRTLQRKLKAWNAAEMDMSRAH